MAVFDVPATELIEAVAEDLKKQVKQPEWAVFVKSGRHRERAPHRRDWFYMRMASVLYRVYKEGGLGTNRLRTYYGGRKNRGVRPHRFFRASGKVLRVCLQELEKIGLLQKEKKGREISGRGESYLNAKAKEVRKVLEEKEAKQKEVEARPAEEKPKEEKKEKPEEKKPTGAEEKPKEKKPTGAEEKPKEKKPTGAEEKPKEKMEVEAGKEKALEEKKEEKPAEENVPVKKEAEEKKEKAAEEKAPKPGEEKKEEKPEKPVEEKK